MTPSLGKRLIAAECLRLDFSEECIAFAVDVTISAMENTAQSANSKAARTIELMADRHIITGVRAIPVVLWRSFPGLVLPRITASLNFKAVR
jgi:hypothetical protein